MDDWSKLLIGSEDLEVALPPTAAVPNVTRGYIQRSAG
jgi:hypothetical protein